MTYDTTLSRLARRLDFEAHAPLVNRAVAQLDSR
jgi:hypothetical protein